jgi:hypothetical protein
MECILDLREELGWRESNTVVICIIVIFCAHLAKLLAFWNGDRSFPVQK